MITHFKAAALIAAAALILAMPLAAQNATEELGALESNTLKATAGLFGNDVDSFVDVHGYGDVLSEGTTWFGFVSGRALDIDGWESMGWVKPEGPEWNDDKATPAYNKPTGYLKSNPTTGLLNLGYARQLGGIYLGLWYQGNMAQITGGFATKTSSIKPDYDAHRAVTSTVQETTHKESWLNTSNQIEALIGVAGMGIKVGFYESLFSNVHEGAAWRIDSSDPEGQSIERDSDYNIDAPVTRVTDNKDGIVSYQNATDLFYTQGGYMRPYLGWGATFGNIKPYVTLGATFKSDKKADNWSDYTKAGGKSYDKTNTVDTGYDFSYIKPEATVGAWIDLAAQEGKSASATIGVEYNFGLYLYNSSYADTGLSGGPIAGTVAWPGVWGSGSRMPAYVNRKTVYLWGTTSATDIQLSINEITEMEHAFTPTYIISGDPVENLSLGFSAALPVDVRTYTSEQRTERHEITETKYNTDTARRNTKTTTITTTQFQSMEELNFGLGLDLAIGASYKLIPNRFSINAGVAATPLSFVNTVTTYKRPTNALVQTVKTVDGQGDVKVDTKTVTLRDHSDAGTWPQDEDYLVQYDQVESNLEWAAFSGNVTGGFTFFFTPNIALDLAASWGKDSFNVDIADVNVLFSFKF